MIVVYSFIFYSCRELFSNAIVDAYLVSYSSSLYDIFILSTNYWILSSFYDIISIFIKKCKIYDNFVIKCIICKFTFNMVNIL